MSAEYLTEIGGVAEAAIGCNPLNAEVLLAVQQVLGGFKPNLHEVILHLNPKCLVEEP